MSNENELKSAISMRRKHSLLSKFGVVPIGRSLLWLISRYGTLIAVIMLIFRPVGMISSFQLTTLQTVI